MYEVLDKDTIKFEILPHLSMAKRGYVTKSDLSEVIQCILYKLKMGCQWHMLPISAIFTGRPLSYKSVYAHFRKWSWNGEWKKVWGIILSRYRSFLDMSSVDWTVAIPLPRFVVVVWIPRTQEKNDHQCHLCRRPARHTACHVYTCFGFPQRPSQHLPGSSEFVRRP